MLGLALGTAFLAGFGFGAGALVVGIGLGWIAVARRGLSVAAAGLIVVTLALGLVRAQLSSVEVTVVPEPGEYEGVARIVDGPFLTANGQRFLIRLESLPTADLCAYASRSSKVFTGDRVFVTGRITLLRDLSTAGLAAANARGCDAQLRLESMIRIESGTGLTAWLSRLRVGLSDELMRADPGDAGALLSGLVTGEDGGLTEQASAAFLSSGTTHITAISGANFTMLVLLLGVMATGAMRRSIWFVGIASVVIWLYALMVGLQPSAFRAALLATAVLGGRLIGRRPDLLTLTVLLAALQIAIRPHDFETLGFQLSLAATVALIMVFDGCERGGDRSWLPTLMLSVFAAQLATIPILALRLGTVSGTGLVANLVVGELAGIAFPIAVVGSIVGQISSAAGEVVLLPAIVICRWIVAFVEWLDHRGPGMIVLGPPTATAIVVLGLVCWLGVFWLSGDLRRMARHGSDIVRSW